MPVLKNVVNQAGMTTWFASFSWFTASSFWVWGERSEGVGGDEKGEGDARIALLSLELRGGGLRKALVVRYSM